MFSSIHNSQVTLTVGVHSSLCDSSYNSFRLAQLHDRSDGQTNSLHPNQRPYQRLEEK